MKATTMPASRTTTPTAIATITMMLLLFDSARRLSPAWAAMGGGRGKEVQEVGDVPGSPIIYRTPLPLLLGCFSGSTAIQWLKRKRYTFIYT